MFMTMRDEWGIFMMIPQSPILGQEHWDKEEENKGTTLIAALCIFVYKESPRLRQSYHWGNMLQHLPCDEVDHL